MGIGAGIFLIAIGAVLRFAVNDKHPGGVDLHMVGVIAMVAGAVGILITLMVMLTRRRTDVVTHDDRAAVVDPAVVAPPADVAYDRPVVARTTYEPRYR